MMSTNAETSLLHGNFASNATVQQPPLNCATGDATGTQQAPAKPLSLLEIARNKLRNNHATSSQNSMQQPPLSRRRESELVASPSCCNLGMQQARLEAGALTGDLAAIRAWLSFIGEHDPAIIADVLGKCCDDADALHYFTERSSEVWRMQS